MPRLVLFGEAMLELSSAEAGLRDMRLAYGGDVLNTAVYLARSGHQPCFISALGVDPYSQRMLADWREEGIDTSFVLRHQARLPGLYAIETDDMGERRFFYWRDNSAARAFFEISGHRAALEYAKDADWFYFTGIALSLYSQENRARLLNLAKTIKARGGQVVFDPNYRPVGWRSPEEAIQTLRAFAEAITIVIPTKDDEDKLHGPASGYHHAQRWFELGVPLVIMKCGSDGAIVCESGKSPEKIAANKIERPKDTTGAGDSFNAAFIAKRLDGASLGEAVKSANKLAAEVIMHRGAIIAR